ncbi:MAG: hypothetical protein CMJ64_12105 [Planctomycetaceae bacterium]|nr:hypothetical protein [Planctomycetaceae bacterium]
MFDGSRFDDDLTVEVTQHPFGSSFGAIDGDDAEVFWPDRLHAFLNFAGGLANESFLRARGFPFLASSNHSKISCLKVGQMHMPLRGALQLVGMSRTRYHAWLGKQECGLDDQPCCPKSSPQQLTRDESLAIRDMVTADEYRHVRTGTLARLAQRLGKVFASPTTWYRLVRAHNWRRPRQRVHPAKPTVGIRATRPNEIWHVDTTLIRLLDGSKAYLHAVIDNFSRRVLAWRVNDSFMPAVTAELLIEAARDVRDATPQLLVDGGVENYNSAVDKLVDSGLLKRILAQTEIRYSNSLIESWWRVLKHQWLYLNTLDTVASAEKLVGFYVEQHNKHLPHSAFKGQTPDEMYFGTGDDIPKKLKTSKVRARELRLKSNRERNCHVCVLPAPANC